MGIQITSVPDDHPTREAHPRGHVLVLLSVAAWLRVTYDHAMVRSGPFRVDG